MDSYLSKYTGLTEHEARKVLEAHGYNSLGGKKTVNPWAILLGQFTSPLIVVLFLSAVLLGVVGYFSGESNLVDIILILIIVLASGLSGFFQDYKAERSIEALERLSSPKAKVIRGGREKEIDATEIVPGDLVYVEEGDVIPADGIILSLDLVKIDEAILTGESSSVGKEKGGILYMNTNLVQGRCVFKVEATGRDTEVGKIAKGLETIEEGKTPFTIEMEVLKNKLFWIVAGITVVIFLVSLVKFSVASSLLTAIALAVAAIPEGLPAVLVLSLAVGARSMAKNKALVRKLGVVESMGSVDVICTDKTGTITKNSMEVVEIFWNGKVCSPRDFPKKEGEVLLLCGAVNNTTRIKKGKVIGDETEVAIQKFSELHKITKETLLTRYKKLYELPFDSTRKMMSTVIERGKTRLHFVKGAPEVILDRCTHVFEDGKVVKLTDAHSKAILEGNTEFAGKALRVLGFAYRDARVIVPKNSQDEKTFETNLIWLGMEAMQDPPRERVREAIEEAESAGITVMMLTGDNPVTAMAIASQVGIGGDRAMTGADLEKITDRELSKLLNGEVRVFARLSPQHKLRIMTLLQKKDHIVAMTGDGVNDALALKKADVGIAMGIRGTEVAKQASDLILLDDNFVSIVSAVREGRRIFNNIRKFVNYLLTANFAEVGVLFVATVVLTLEEPILLPIHLLWINLLTDGFPALALGVDPAPRDLMKEQPRKKHTPVIDKAVARDILVIGIKMTAVLFGIYFLTLPLGDMPARTALFTGFVLYEFVRIGNLRVLEKLSWFSNKWLLIAVGISIFLQVLLVYTPLNTYFQIEPLGLTEWGIILGGVTFGYLVAFAMAKTILKKNP